MNTQDPFHLQRFLDAQKNDYADALHEIKQGYKQSHWIWFIFPQMRGLGRSSMAEYYGISSIEEARAYLDNPTLKARLFEISTALFNLNSHRNYKFLNLIRTRGRRAKDRRQCAYNVPLSTRQKPVMNP